MSAAVPGQADGHGEVALLPPGPVHQEAGQVQHEEAALQVGREEWFAERLVFLLSKIFIREWLRMRAD